MNVFYPAQSMVIKKQIHVLTDDTLPENSNDFQLPTLNEAQFLDKHSQNAQSQNMHNQDAQNQDTQNQDTQNPIITATPNIIMRHLDKNLSLLLDADNQLNDIQALLNHIHHCIVYVKDFKDGRIFSLIRQIHQSDHRTKIWICGQYSADQVAYLSKIGVSAFVADDDKLTTIQKTIDDLQTASHGASANELPMFRQFA